MEATDQEEAVAAVRQTAAEADAAAAASAEPKAPDDTAHDGDPGTQSQIRPPESAQPESAQPESPELALAASLPDYGQAPEFGLVEGWINSDPLTLAELRGKVVVIDFWTYSCVNCIRTFPYLKRWHDRYADDGLLIVGVLP